MSEHIFTNPVFRTTVLKYERLVDGTKDIWISEYHLFSSKEEIEEDLAHYRCSVNIRNAEVYDVIIDLTKPLEQQTLPETKCHFCGKTINRKENKKMILCDDKFYCSYYCCKKDKKQL